MEETNQKFQVQTETGEIKEAELLAVMTIDAKKYAVYSIDNGNETVDILASYVVTDEEGYDKLVDITDPTDKQKITEEIQKLAQ